MSTQISEVHQQESDLGFAYRQVRKESEKLCAPLVVEDYGIQTMPDVSPPKWHLAHTSWFFETFILKPFFTGYQVFHPRFEYLFNSYYEQVGSFHPRPQRGLLSRPTVEEIYHYRAYVDQAMASLLAEPDHSKHNEVVTRTAIGLHHEQQHQELLLTDIKHIFANNPLKPIYQSLPVKDAVSPGSQTWHEHPGGVFEIGSDADKAFSYDNESPRHKVYLQPFRIAERLVTNEEYLEFVESGAYRQPQFWLSDGWKLVNEKHWHAPLYWENIDGQWHEMTLAGLRELDLAAPVSHVSLYEAQAFALWQDKRLPGEAEWEVVAADLPITGNLRDQGYLHPMATTSSPGLRQFYGDVWEWTQSSYAAYPGYRAADGALGEYNGKFMSSQMVLRGGSCVTPTNHIRATYRNFFYPGDRWQFSGIRLAETISCHK